MNKPLQILIVDDHPIFRQGILKLLQSDTTFEIIGECSDGPEAIDFIIKNNPDLAIIDMSLPTMSGLEVIKTARDQTKCLFIILTMYKDEAYFNAALDLGVKGYLLKDNAGNELLNCLKSVANKQYYVCPILSEYLVHRKIKEKQLVQENPGIELLTLTEKKVLKLISENKTSREIAELLFISHRTVQNHRTHICEKLGFKGHNKLLHFAIENKSSL